MPPLDGIVIVAERLLAFLDLADDERAVDDGLEAADGRAFVEREDVDGLDRLRLRLT